MIVYILMGVAGCGKSTIGREAAKRLEIPFLEGDDFHPPLNIAKMSSGVPLSDEDREPWVDSIVEGCKSALAKTEKKGPIILACSALSKTVRQRLRAGLSGNCRFIHLHGDHITLKRRLSDRGGHFFKVDLLASQFTALQMPRRADTIDIAQPVDALATQVCEIVKSENKA